MLSQPFSEDWPYDRNYRPARRKCSYCEHHVVTICLMKKLFSEMKLNSGATIGSNIVNSLDLWLTWCSTSHMLCLKCNCIRQNMSCLLPLLFFRVICWNSIFYNQNSWEVLIIQFDNCILILQLCRRSKLEVVDKNDLQSKRWFWQSLKRTDKDLVF